MTIEHACEILNREYHRGTADWHIDTGFACSGGVVLNSFEAIAIAKEYERLASSRAAKAVAGVLADAGLIGDVVIGE